MAAIGGILLSWITAVYFTREDALAEHQAQLASHMRDMSHQLGVVSAQIREAVFKTLSGETTAETCYAQILQAHSSLSGLLNQMQSVSGNEVFDPDTIIDTAEQVKKLGSRLSALASAQAGGAGTAQADQELAALRSELDEALARLPAPGASSASARCPECGAYVSFGIGRENGDSASPTCSECGYRFHAHRRADGTVFTRRPGVAAPPPAATADAVPPTRTIVGAQETTVPCPSCKTDVQLEIGAEGGSSAMLRCGTCSTRFNVHRLPSGELMIRTPHRSIDFECPTCHATQRMDLWHERSGHREWLCLNCLSKLTVDLDTSEVVGNELQAPQEAALMDPLHLRCPACGLRSKSFGKHDDRSIAWCAGCHRLLIEKQDEVPGSTAPDVPDPPVEATGVPS